MDIKEIKEIASKYSHDQIEGCIRQQVESGSNSCVIMDAASEEIVNDLSEASFVKELMGQGMTFHDALRELARRIRNIVSDTAQPQKNSK